MVEVVMHHGALGDPDLIEGFIESAMRLIAARAEQTPASVGVSPGNSWADKYGTDFENDIFMMHRYCWCEREECQWCYGGEPNFLHKDTGFSVSWYKYIGRGMEIDMAGLNDIGVARIILECMDSLGGIPTDGIRE